MRFNRLRSVLTKLDGTEWQHRSPGELRNRTLLLLYLLLRSTTAQTHHSLLRAAIQVQLLRQVHTPGIKCHHLPHNHSYNHSYNHNQRHISLLLLLSILLLISILHRHQCRRHRSISNSPFILPQGHSAHGRQRQRQGLTIVNLNLNLSLSHLLHNHKTRQGQPHAVKRKKARGVVWVHNQAATVLLTSSSAGQT